MGIYRRSVPYLGITVSPRKNIYWAPMMCPDHPAHQGSFLWWTEETKTFKYQETLKASGGHHVGTGRSLLSINTLLNPCFYLTVLLVPSLPSLYFLSHCSKVFPPCNLMYFTGSFTFSVLFQKFRGVRSHVFFRLNGLTGTERKTAHPKDELILLLSFPFR